LNARNLSYKYGPFIPRGLEVCTHVVKENEAEGGVSMLRQALIRAGPSEVRRQLFLKFVRASESRTLPVSHETSRTRRTFKQLK